jgi:uncharacterized protein with PIN domain
MLVETSAIVAIMLEESDAETLAERVSAAGTASTTVVNAFEAALSVGRVIEDHPLAAELVPPISGERRNRNGRDRRRFVS